MTFESDEGDASALSPDDAFAVLGNDTRMEILQTLGEADEPLRFSELRDRIGVRDSGRFNYHLDKLTGHFITETDDGYALRPAGTRVVEAVLSRVVVDDLELDTVQVDDPCPYCGAPVEVDFHHHRLQRFCPDCQGSYGVTSLGTESVRSDDRGFLGHLHLPPAGISARSPEAMFEAAKVWTHLEYLKAPNGLCPRCSAPLEASVSVCPDHDDTDVLCTECNRRHAIQIHGTCTNCIFEGTGHFSLWLLTNIDLVAFLVAHGVNPLTEEGFGPVTENYDEELLSSDPFEARFTFTVDGDALTLTVDDDLEVIEVGERHASEGG